VQLARTLARGPHICTFGCKKTARAAVLCVTLGSSIHWTCNMAFAHGFVCSSIMQFNLVCGSVQLNPLDMRFPSRANAGVLSWAGKLYALSQVRGMSRAGS